MSAVDTLRVSVTDRCNLRCIYCMPPEGIQAKSHQEILSFEEIERVVRTAVRAGVKKVRLTGGEPLTRKHFERLVEMLSPIEGLNDLAMTTNGALLAQNAKALKRAGLKRVTVSLDTLNSEKYTEITGASLLDDALSGIDTALELGLEPLKINVVVMRGVNDGEVVDLARFASRKGVEVRFIELMPMSSPGGTYCAIRSGDGTVPAAETMKKIEDELGALEPLDKPAKGPARIFSLPGGSGRVGFISPVTNPFCSTCTRMRLTADGKLRGCLFSDSEIELLKPMRSGADDEEIFRLFNEAVQCKPERAHPEFSGAKRWMVEIGG